MNMIHTIFRKSWMVALMLLGLSVTMTGCFDIEERMTFNKDGSGNYAIVMDMSEMGAMLQGFIESQGEGGEGNEMGDAFKSMDSTFQAMAVTLRKQEGISNVSVRSETFKYEISYDFGKVDDIYKAQKALQESAEEGESGGFMQGSTDEPQFTLNARKRIFNRINAPIENVLGDTFAMGEEDEEGTAEMAKMFLKDANYRTVYSFPGPVKKFTNEEATLSADQKTVTLEISFLDLMEGNVNIGNEIRYKKN